LAELVLLGEPQYLDELAENLLMACSVDQFKDAQYALRQIIIKQQSVKQVRSKLAYRVKKYIEEGVEIENIIYNYCAYCDNESNTLDEELIDVLIGLFGESREKYSAILHLKILNTLYRDILLKKNAEKYIGTFYEIKENCSNKLIYDKVCRIIEDPAIWRSSNLELVEGEN
jgi:dihydropteroate synthase